MKNHLKRFRQFINENDDYGMMDDDTNDGREYRNEYHNKVGGQFTGDNIVRTEIDYGTDDQGSVDEWLEELQDLLDKYQLEIVGFIPFGPGAGNSVITFRGKEKNIKALLAWYFMMSGEISSPEELDSNYDDMIMPDRSISENRYYSPDTISYSDNMIGKENPFRERRVPESKFMRGDSVIVNGDREGEVAGVMFDHERNMFKYRVVVQLPEGGRYRANLWEDELS
jgi:hypothetical protein